MRVTSRRWNTNPTVSERAFKLAEEHKFDELLEHLRVDDPRYGRLVDTCVRDERLLHVCARAGCPRSRSSSFSSNTVRRRDIFFQSAAHNGRVDLLEAARARGWSDECTYGVVFFAAAEGGDALAVFKWLVNHRATLDSGDHNGVWMVEIG